MDGIKMGHAVVKQKKMCAAKNTNRSVTISEQNKTIAQRELESKEKKEHSEKPQ